MRIQRLRRRVDTERTVARKRNAGAIEIDAVIRAAVADGVFAAKQDRQREVVIKNVNIVAINA